MDTIRQAALSFKNRITLNKLERQVAEVCTNENWGTQNTQLREIADKTFNPEDRRTIMKILWDLLKAPPKEWRRVYKVLALIEHLVKFGSSACVSELRDETFRIRMFTDFSYREEAVERGTGIRDKAKYVVGLLSDHKLLEEEREQAKQNLNRYTGIGRDDYSGGSRYYDRDDSRKDYDPYVKQEYDPYVKQEYVRPDPPQQQRVLTEPFGQKVDIFSAPEVKPVGTLSKGSVGAFASTGKLPPPPGKTDIFGEGKGSAGIFGETEVQVARGMWTGMSVKEQRTPDPFGAERRQFAEPQNTADFVVPAQAAFLQPTQAVFPNQPQTTVFPNSPQTGYPIQPQSIFPNPSLGSQMPPPNLNFPLSSPNLPPQYQSGESWSAAPPQAPPPLKITSNFGDSSGPTISQIKYNPSMSAGYTSVQSPPSPEKSQVSVTLESKLTNLDNIHEGQPKPTVTKETRWY